MLKSNHKVVVVVEEVLFLDLFDVLDAVFQGDIFQDFISKDEKQPFFQANSTPEHDLV